MTGTALTEATEFMKIYKIAGGRGPDQPRRWSAATTTTRSTRPRTASGRPCVDEISERHESGQPVLVGTISVEVSEMLSGELKRAGVEHEVLNAKPEYAEREGETSPRRAGSARSRSRPTWPAAASTSSSAATPSSSPTDELRKLGVTPERRELRRGARRACPNAQGADARPRATRCASSAGCSSAAPSATSRGGSTTSFAAAPAARATPASRASSSPPRTTSSGSSPATGSTRSSTGSAPSTRRARSTRSRRRC